MCTSERLPEGVAGESPMVCDGEELASAHLFAVATADIDLYNNCKSWSVLSKVKRGDAFMMTGVAKSYDGWMMTRVCDGGALQSDFLDACVFSCLLPCVNMFKKAPR